MRFSIKGYLKDLYFLTHRALIGERASILSYHNIGTDSAFFTVTSQSIDRQLEYLKKNDYSVVLLSELVRKVRDKEDISRHVAITFNDGYYSVYEHVLPLLKKYHMPVSVFTTVEFLDTNIQTSDGFTFRTLSMAAIRDMLASNLVEFFPQTQHRQPLDGVAFEHAIARIEQARADLESVIKKPAAIFSYPKGRYTQKIVEQLAASGWLGAVTVKEGLVTKDTNPFLLPRNSIDSRTSFTQFKGKVSGAIDAYVKARSA